MKNKRTFIALTLIVTFLLSVTPIYTDVHAESMIDVTVKPSVQYETFDGWGTSLAWWGNAIGQWSDSTKKDEIMDLLFDENKGLGFNIVRYNIGGGENPSHEHMRDKAEIEGYQPLEGVWEWSADSSQRWVLQEAKKRGVNIFEAFSNAPPYWMTYSQCSAGATFGGNNLKTEYYDDFAHYITEVLKHFEDDWEIYFNTVTPLNEPNSIWWKSSNNQEGCHFDRDRQNIILDEVRQDLIEKGLETRLSAPEEYNIDDTIESYHSYDKEVKSYINQINTHTYAGSNRVGLYGTAIAEQKDLWVSEVGAGGSASHDHNDLTSAIDLANKITTDLREMHSNAWVYWQVIEDEAGKNNWGMIDANFSGEEQYWVTKKYYAMANFSKYIRQGQLLIENDNNNIVSTYDPESKQVVLVITNNGNSDILYNIDLSEFSSVGSFAKGYRTSATENIQQLSNINTENNHLNVTATTNSITTYLIDDTNFTGDTAFDRERYYKIINKNSGKVLDVNEESKLNGENIIQSTYNNADSQLWRIIEAKDGVFYLINGKSQKMLDVNKASKYNGKKIIQWQCNGDNNQLWRIKLLESGYYKLVNVNSNKALDVLDESTLDGSSVIQWDYWGGDNQQWMIQKVQ